MPTCQVTVSAHATKHLDLVNKTIRVKCRHDKFRVEMVFPPIFHVRNCTDLADFWGHFCSVDFLMPCVNPGSGPIPAGATAPKVSGLALPSPGPSNYARPASPSPPPPNPMQLANADGLRVPGRDLAARVKLRRPFPEEQLLGQGCFFFFYSVDPRGMGDMGRGSRPNPGSAGPGGRGV